jgi:hypothetical protein
VSSGHSHFQGFGLNSQALERLLANEKVQEYLYAPKTFDEGHDIPYLAGYAGDGHTIYFDRHLPKILKMERDGSKIEINPREFLRLHESLEKALIDALGYGYTEAHKAATAYEKRGVLQRLGPGWWEAYSKKLEPFIKADEHEKLVKVPKDLDLLPYRTPPVDRKLLAHLEKFVATEKVSKEVAKYHSDGKPSRHCGPDKDWPRNYCEYFQQGHSCKKVVGYISTKAGCDLFERAE